MSDIVDEIGRVVEAKQVDFDRLEQLLDDASANERESALDHFGSSVQQRVFEQAEGRSVELDQIVPPDADPLEPVVHQGRNTLPAFQSFQKRFCRPPADYVDEHGERVWGYNDQTFMVATGPGYFVGYEDESTGEFLIDYRELPEESPEPWPEIVSNSNRLGRFVYAGTVDRLRRLASRVVVGRAYVGEDDPMNAWFVLVRRDLD